MYTGFKKLFPPRCIGIWFAVEDLRGLQVDLMEFKADLEEFIRFTVDLRQTVEDLSRIYRICPSISRTLDF